MIWAALSMTAALVMTACTNDDNAVETPAAPQAEVKTIPYSVTVGQGGDAATTRATVESDMKTLYFATGDKLYITGTNISGTLDIQTGTGTASATFSGDLTYTGEGSPASDLALTATLVSAQQTVGTEVSVSDAGAVTVNYPTTAYCDDVATAVQKYSNLTGTSNYGEKSFTLSQQTAFLNFEITFEDGTATGTGLSAVVKNGETTLCTANRTTTTESEKVVAKFVLPVASGTTLSSATVKMGDKEALAITDATLTGKVYNVKKAAKAPAVTPNIAQADCTFSPSNGKSTLSNANITTSMEYSADNGTTWTDVTSNGFIASLAAGTVQIRVKETVDNLASEAVSITVPEVLHINELVGPYTGDRLTCEYYAGETWQALVDRYDLIKVYSGRAAFGSDGFIYYENGSAVPVTDLVDNTKTYEVQ